MNVVVAGMDSRPTGVARPVDHWARFAEFCHWEQKVGGPDPQIAMIGHLGKAENRDALWLAGCYAAVYNVAGAYVLMDRLHRDMALHWPPADLAAFLEAHWRGIPIRKERRAIRTPGKLARSLKSYAEWCETGTQYRPWMNPENKPTDNYALAWKDILNVYGIGRYVAIKWLEWAQRHHGAPIDLKDIRSRGGWSPRQALAVLWPGMEDICNSTDPATDQPVEKLADVTIRRLAEDYGVHVTHFGLQVMLCEYRESYESRRQYPGRSHDSEMKYIRAVEEYWGPQPELWAVRQTLFPIEALGEFGGWEGPREDVAQVLADYGYTWTDVKYDYPASRKMVDLSTPAVRGIVR